MAALNFKEILDLIDKVADKSIAAIEVESAGQKLRIEGKRNDPPPTYSFDPQQEVLRVTQSGSQGVPALASAAQTDVSEPAGAPVGDEIDPAWHLITSPIVGTFYRSPNPDAPVFVNVGDNVAKGSALCIIEAMKLMNEIESDVEGVVAKVFTQNSQPVEYGEKLFAIKV